jgi:hypothetical protein
LAGAAAVAAGAGVALPVDAGGGTVPAAFGAAFGTGLAGVATAFGLGGSAPNNAEKKPLILWKRMAVSGLRSNVIGSKKMCSATPFDCCYCYQMMQLV